MSVSSRVVDSSCDVVIQSEKNTRSSKSRTGSKANTSSAQQSNSNKSSCNVPAPYCGDVGTCHNIINSIATTLREPILEIQEKRGISRNAHITFFELVTAIFNHSYNAFMAIITMLVALFPVVDAFLWLGRFVLDKIIEINDTESIGDKIFKTLVFLIEFLVLFVMVFLLLAILLLPVLHLVLYIIGRAIRMLK